MKFRVTYYFHSNCTVEVEANSAEEAIANGYSVDCTDQIIEGLQEDDSPDCEEVED